MAVVVVVKVKEDFSFDCSACTMSSTKEQKSCYWNLAVWIL
uniref:Uncharacterized protein n=1 Tax=Rhizophora mucronata TaxID=61149 RepID=A0A2P2NW56_RHIMU